MNEFKSERRERQREKRRRGMQVSNTGIRVLARLNGLHPTHMLRACPGSFYGQHVPSETRPGICGACDQFLKEDPS